MGEIKVAEADETKNSKPENYKQIKPEGQHSPESSRDFIRNNFMANAEVKPDEPRREFVDGHMQYYDDNGEIFRVDDELKPNSEYMLNGYHYETDSQGRIVTAEGKLQLKERDERLMIRDDLHEIGKGDEQKGDDRGHLIGDRFNGSNGLENMIPQDSKINQTDYRNFENKLAKEVQAGKDVRVKIEPEYTNDSHRPDSICVTYSIDGEKNIRIFPNGKD